MLKRSLIIPIFVTWTLIIIFWYRHFTEQAEKKSTVWDREEAKQKAEHNRKEADERFNQRVEEEIQKRMGKIHLDKINEVVDEKIKAKTPRKPKKNKDSGGSEGGPTFTWLPLGCIFAFLEPVKS